MSRHLLALGTLVQLASLSPLVWVVVTGAQPPVDVWTGAAELGLSGIALQAGALALAACGWWRPRPTPNPRSIATIATPRSN